MENSSINETWKFYTLGSLVGCTLIFLFLNQTDLYVTFSAAKNTMVEYKQNFAISPFGRLETEAQKKCNLFEGKWVFKPKEESHRGQFSYDASQCPFIDKKFNCRKNGRPDLEYEMWSWEATNCVIPLFNGRDMLERLRDKRMILVGDSLNRNQWESLACLLYTSIPPSATGADAESHTYKVLKVKDYNFTLEFYWSPFIIELDENNESGSKVLNLDKLPATSEQWRGADIMVFNSGHWWTHLGKFRSYAAKFSFLDSALIWWELFQHEGKLIEDMPIEQAFKLGMETWEKWVSNNVDPKKTTLFFRSISPEHQTQWCYNSTQPVFDEPYTSKFPNSLIKTIEGLIEKMNEKMLAINYMNITKLSQYRRDAHPSIYRSMQWEDGLEKLDLRAFADCSHWCLPGLPDTWNRLLYASLLFDSSSDMSSF